MCSKIITVKDFKKLNIDNKKIVFTNGCFDIVHAGHADFFKKAKNIKNPFVENKDENISNVLVVGVNSDQSVKNLKGNSRPIISQKHRLKLLESISYIDYLILFNQTTPYELICEIKPYILLKGVDWKTKGGIVGKEFLESYGGLVKYINLYDELSTSYIINRIVNIYGK